ncbi:MAG: hypothetical protein KAQ98_00300 [Bacteriovoracaceae bacterium]|nr:hypothetical protein [Bacteriovoracaceae bacterium]
MKPVDIIFSAKDFQQFRDWIKLNLEGLTWQGRFEKEFEEFWHLFFIDGLSINQVTQRFQYAFSEIKIGPVVAWFKWLREKFLCYSFIYKDISILTLADATETNVSELAVILRSFFLDVFPHLDDYFSTIFQIGNVASSNLDITFDSISDELDISGDFVGSREFEIMPSMEITLYKGWTDFIKKIKKDLYYYDVDLKKLELKASWKRYPLFFAEIVGILLLGIVLVEVIVKYNDWYQKQQNKKISDTYNAPFQWIDKKYKTKEDATDAIKELDPELIDLDGVKINMSKGDGDREIGETNVWGTESDVVLTSWDALPKDFNLTELEQSDYEEMRKGGFRDTRFGNRKAYRIMVNSVNTINTREMMNNLLEKYNVIQADNVKPGTFVPGGVYYNLFVPRQFLREFLMQVHDVGNAVIYESRTRHGNPPGRNKVFIWIKSF